MKTNYLLVVALFASIIFSSCQKTEEVVIAPLNCEEVNGEFICYSGADTDKGTKITKWCVYKNLGCKGKDCPKKDPDDICVKCPKKKKCPQKVSLKVKDKDIRFRVKLSSTNCIKCPKGGYKAEFVD